MTSVGSIHLFRGCKEFKQDALSLWSTIKDATSKECGFTPFSSSSHRWSVWEPKEGWVHLTSQGQNSGNGELWKHSHYPETFTYFTHSVMIAQLFLYYVSRLNTHDFSFNQPQFVRPNKPPDGYHITRSYGFRGSPITHNPLSRASVLLLTDLWTSGGIIIICL